MTKRKLSMAVKWLSCHGTVWYYRYQTKQHNLGMGQNILKHYETRQIIFFWPMSPWNLTDDLEKQQDTSSILLCVLCIFHSHRWIWNRVPVWKLGSKSMIFVLCEPEIMPYQALCIVLLPYVNSNWSYSPTMAKFGFDLCDLDLWSLTMTFCMNITCVIGNNSF